MPTFSFAPSPYIARIGEHLLGLPQQLEPYADSEYLTLGNQWLPYFDATRDTAPAEGEKELIDYTEPWIVSVVKTTIHDYLVRILEIPHLSDQGVKQLLADLQYFRNVLSALEISLQPDFDELQRYLATNQADLKALLAEKGQQESPLFLKVATMRGLSLAGDPKKVNK